MPPTVSQQAGDTLSATFGESGEIRGLFRSLLEAAPDAMIVVDRDGRIVLVNSQVEHLFGWTRDELLGQAVELLIPEQLRAEHVSHRATYAKTPRTRAMGVGLELRGRRKDGTEFPVDVSLSPLHFRSRPLVIAAVRDVTERQQAAETLQKEREFLNALIENLAEGIAACDAQGTLMMFNRALREIHGLPAEPIPFDRWAEYYDLYQPDGRTRMPAEQLPLMRALRGETVRDVEVVIKPKGRPPHIVEVHGQPIAAPSGKNFGAVAVVHDVTERRQAEQALRAVQQNYEALVNSIDGIVWEVDVETFDFLFVSQKAERILGYPLSAWFEKPNAWLKNLHPDDRDQALNFCITETKAKRDHVFEYRVIAADGRIVWLQDRVHVVIENGEPVKLRGVMLDITERKQAEDALRASERSLAEVQVMAHLGSVAWDLSSNRLWFSDEACRLYGIEPGTPMTFDDTLARIHPDDRAQVLEVVRRMVEERPPMMPMEYRLVWPDGSVRYVYGEGHGVPNEKGEIVRTEGFLQDVTERKLREQQILENQARLRLLHDVASSATSGGSVEQVIERSVTALAEAFPDVRVSYSTLDERGALKVIARQGPLAMPSFREAEIDFAAVPGYLETLRRGAPIAVRDIREDPRFAELAKAQTSGGARLDLPVRHSHNLLGLLCLRAPTPRAWTDHETETLTSVAQQLSVVLSDAQARAERLRAMEALTRQAEALFRSNQELERFAYVASHDLQEPLRTVHSYLQLIERRYRDRLDATGAEYMRFITEAVDRMGALIEDLLAYSRLNSQTGPLVPTDLGAVLDNTLSLLGAAIRDSGARVTRDPLPTVEGDPFQLGQLLQNLIGNALKFRGQQPPQVHVGARRDDAEWVISVRDNGIGIEPRYQERIFVIFQRLHTSDQYPGTGIGLAICKKIVERHGGRMWVESGGVDCGSTFYFTLPVSPARRVE